ncbi:unnamed protein product [Dibothriocephalus latus]|uniref:Trafficking protein particle complex subunit n=1 Tax=Dibothriocephalus latus TaxID=60516 RepID=A0A3P7P413_DIBLA|nr:unnamed protein product [Dibothriocephalus latus]
MASAVFSNPSNFPIKINFGLPPLSPNDRITLASMFQAIHQMSRILTPVTALSKLDDKSRPGSNGSGIQTLETPECRLHCYESITGAKFLLVTDHRIPANARDALKLVYSAYTDYVLKNPFYSQNQPFNFEFFNEKVKKICEQVERGIFT